MTLDALIHKLATDVGATKCDRDPQCLWRIFLLWVLLAGVYMSLILAFYLHPRADLAVKFHEPLFMAEIVTLSALGLSAIFTAALLSFPDHYQWRRIIYLPVVLFGAFCAVMAWAWYATVPANPPMPSGMECLVCITLLSVLPALVIFRKIRQMASTRPTHAGAAAALAAFAIGALTLRLSEDTNSITHLVIWHYAPMLLAAAIGIVIGKKLFKW